MTGILRSKTFPGENMSEMSAAPGAFYLGTDTVGIGCSFHCAVYLVVESWPPAMPVELVGRTVKRSPAFTAMVCSGFVEIVVFSGERHLRTFSFYNLRFYRRERRRSILFCISVILLFTCPLHCGDDRINIVINNAAYLKITIVFTYNVYQPHLYTAYPGLCLTRYGTSVHPLQKDIFHTDN